MRDLRLLDRFRIPLPPVLIERWQVPPAGTALAGAFMIRSEIDGRGLRIIASTGDGWDHVSVSLLNRCPRWAEMEQVKRLFFHATEVAMQLHVARADHISHHPYCMHLWRPQTAAIPLPPKELVA